MAKWCGRVIGHRGLCYVCSYVYRTGYTWISIGRNAGASRRKENSDVGCVVGHIRSWSTAGVSGQKIFNHNNFIYLL